MLATRHDLHHGAHEAPVDGDEIDVRDRRQGALFAVGAAVRVVIVAVGPENDASDSRSPHRRRAPGRARRARRRASADGKSYSSQPHWIHRKGVSVSNGLLTGTPPGRRADERSPRDVSKHTRLDQLVGELPRPDTHARSVVSTRGGRRIPQRGCGQPAELFTLGGGGGVRQGDA